MQAVPASPSRPEACCQPLPNAAWIQRTSITQAKIRTQVEFYFSDENLPSDEFLKKKMKNGMVGLPTIAGFSRVKKLSTSLEFILEALSSSPLLTVQSLSTSEQPLKRAKTAKIGRNTPLLVVDTDEIKYRTVQVLNLPVDTSIQALTARMAVCGTVVVARIQPDGRRRVGIVEYAAEGGALRAERELTEHNNWRGGLRVEALMTRGKGKSRQQPQLLQEEPSSPLLHDAEEEEEGASSNQKKKKKKAKPNKKKKKGPKEGNGEEDGGLEEEATPAVEDTTRHSGCIRRVNNGKYGFIDKATSASAKRKGKGGVFFHVTEVKRVRQGTNEEEPFDPTKTKVRASMKVEYSVKKGWFAVALASHPAL
jgi:La-related protein 7